MRVGAREVVLRVALALACSWPVLGAQAKARFKFTDVPRGHWAENAVQTTVDAGVLQGFDGKFHGRNMVNRYQLALASARLLERIRTEGTFKKQSLSELKHLEGLMTEFADEQSLLTVKVGKLEDSSAGTRRDIDELKAGGASAGCVRGRSSAGLHGLISARAVLTDWNGPSNAVGSLSLTGGRTFVPLTRYSGSVGGASGSEVFTRQFFFTLA